MAFDHHTAGTLFCVGLFFSPCSHSALIHNLALVDITQKVWGVNREAWDVLSSLSNKCCDNDLLCSNLLISHGISNDLDFHDVWWDKMINLMPFFCVMHLWVWMPPLLLNHCFVARPWQRVAESEYRLFFFHWKLLYCVKHMKVDIAAFEDYKPLDLDVLGSAACRPYPLFARNTFWLGQELVGLSLDLII